MSFYETLSRYYDEVFPVSPQEMRFVGGLLAGRRSLLDIGCGTGNKTILLAGDAVTMGIDADPAMIAAAQTNNAKDNIRYMPLDMLEIGKKLPQASFDAAVCLGNTLAHLTGSGDLVSFLGQARFVLAEGGEFIVQILNYDRILDNGIAELPVIETDHVVFRREYEWRGGEMYFVTTLAVKGGETLRNAFVLNPIRFAELAEGLRNAGFADAAYYGSYAGEAYSADSFHLIARASAH